MPGEAPVVAGRPVSSHVAIQMDGSDVGVLKVSDIDTQKQLIGP
jgi:hypothetical protein